MEFDLIPQFVLIFSIGIILFILGKNIPKIKEAQYSALLTEGENIKKEKRNFWYLYSRFIKRISRNNHQDSYQGKKYLLWHWLEKLLRKTRINFLKLDNKIVSVLDKIRKKNVQNENSEKDILIKKTEDDKEKKDVAEIKVVEEKKEINFVSDDLNNNEKQNGFAALLQGELEVEKTIEEKEEEEKVSEKRKGEIEEDNKIEKKNEIEIKNKKNNKEREYIDLILKNPTDIKAYWKLGIVYSRRKKYQDSISCFRQIIKIDPNYTKAKKKVTDLVKRMKKGKKEEGQKEK